MAPGVDAGDTAWMLAATALVLLMTPALGLFYAGLVRAKNTLNTFMMCIAALAVATITWALVGYSLAFAPGNGVIGGLDFAFLSGVAFAPRDGTKIPHLLFMAFQATFCIVTTALVAGAVVERMRFGPFLAFAALWSVLVYAVLAHWVWGGGWLQFLVHRACQKIPQHAYWCRARRDVAEKPRMTIEERVLEEEACGVVKQPGGIGSVLRQPEIRTQRLADNGAVFIPFDGPLRNASQTIGNLIDESMPKPPEVIRAHFECCVSWHRSLPYPFEQIRLALSSAVNQAERAIELAGSPNDFLIVLGQVRYVLVNAHLGFMTLDRSPDRLPHISRIDGRGDRPIGPREGGADRTIDVRRQRLERRLIRSPLPLAVDEIVELRDTMSVCRSRDCRCGELRNGDVIRVAVGPEGIEGHNDVRLETTDMGRDLFSGLRYVCAIQLAVHIVEQANLSHPQLARGSPKLGLTRAPDYFGSRLRAFVVEAPTFPARRRDDISGDPFAGIFRQNAAGSQRLIVWMGEYAHQ